MMQLHDILLPTLRNGLTTLAGLLDRAVEAADADRLAGARLAADMLPLASQVRFVAAQPHEFIARLSGRPMPDPLDTAADLAGMKAQVAESLARMADADTAAIDADPDGAIAFSVPMGITFELTRAGYVRDWALPQFYFHLVTAYAILRANGVELGKRDYVPHMLAHARMTAPAEA